MLLLGCLAIAHEPGATCSTISVDLSVTDENIQAVEDADSVRTLRVRYDSLSRKPEAS